MSFHLDSSFSHWPRFSYEWHYLVNECIHDRQRLQWSAIPPSLPTSSFFHSTSILWMHWRIVHLCPNGLLTDSTFHSPVTITQALSSLLLYVFCYWYGAPYCVLGCESPFVCCSIWLVLVIEIAIATDDSRIHVFSKKTSQSSIEHVQIGFHDHM